MGEKDRAFIEYERRDPAYRPVEKRIKDFKRVEIPLTNKEIRTQAARCMDCGIPFCQSAASGCSLCNIIPEFNEHVYYGRWQEALEILLSTNTFPEFTGRVCPAPCEGACVLGINKSPVNICKIELAVIEQGFQRGYIKSHPPRARRKEHVAIVGSGPAGLAAAVALNKAGVNVTVYENARKPGGLLRYGIPDFKMEKWVLDRRIDLMKEAEIVFECGVEIGRDLSFRFLHDRFDAIVLAGGAGKPRDLNIPGREFKGIHFAMDFLTQQNKIIGSETIEGEEPISAEGKNVLVIGGGDTGSDCIGTSWRQGAKSVTQLEILPEPPPTRSETSPWPMWPIMRRDSSSHKEGGKRLWGVSTGQFLGKDGRVEQVKCVEVKWVPHENSGPHSPREVPGSEFTLDAELVLLAMGFVGPGGNRLVEEIGIEKNTRGFIGCDDSGMTNVAGVFVAGDMARGPSLVVHAISSGMRTGRDVLSYLNNVTS